ncbi:PH domain-containing protein [Methanobacterium sp.]|jgi:membrane protein YdbS with pleckstrin-like domain|uniref:PH domain-containing protein n=1 Tax=Methanobacterium sp. TaxID=2164 RepID=UPI00315944FD
MRHTKDIRSGERILFETKPRFFMYLKSAVIKFIALLVIIFIFEPVVSLVASIQNYIIKYIHVPLVEATTLILFFLMLILILWIIWDILSWEYTTYTLTNYRVILEKGIIRKNKSYMHYDKIQDVNVSQGLIERLTSSGDISVYGGHENTRIILNDIPDPTKVEDRINQMIEGDYITEKSTGPKKIKDSVMDRYDKKFKRY